MIGLDDLASLLQFIGLYGTLTVILTIAETKIWSAVKQDLSIVMITNICLLYQETDVMLSIKKIVYPSKIMMIGNVCMKKIIVILFRKFRHKFTVLKKPNKIHSRIQKSRIREVTSAIPLRKQW